MPSYFQLLLKSSQVWGRSWHDKGGFGRGTGSVFCIWLEHVFGIETLAGVKT